MATFTVVVSYHFDQEYEVEAGSYEEAEHEALLVADEWKPYSSEKGYTDNWYAVEIESIDTEDEVED